MDSSNSKELISKYIEYVKDKSKHGFNPVTALDYSSLYPSLIMTYNLSPEYLITDENYKNRMEEKGYPIHEIDFVYNYEDAYQNQRSKTIKGWTIRHEESKKDSRFGLYPEILKNLFSMRAEMKKSLEKYKDIKEHMEKQFAEDKVSSEDISNNKEYQDCLFNLNYCDTKQKALKVYMNCFYGELGNKNSPLFILELAGGITSAGQSNLRKVKKFIEDNGCKTYYGDTDSLYFTFHDDKFIDIHKQYFLTTYSEKLLKQDYCTELVNRTFKLVKEMAVRVNEFLNKDNGTKYLKMAYEEVLFPVVFLSRKKYYGIAHEKIVNFKPKNIFIRGLEVKKRGVSEILRIICLETMWESMDIYNFKTLREMVMAKIDYLYSKEWKMEEFIQTGLWKPNKKNQTLIRYIGRVIAEGRDPPDAYERFNYVIVKIKDPARLYDFKGRKIDIKKGDKMEYVEYAEKNNMEIDLDYYFEKQLTGQFARLISYDEEFHVYNNEEWKEDEEMEIEDVKTMRLCRKFIKEYASKWSSGYSDMANVYREIFRSANKFINNSKNSIISKDKQLGVMMMDMYESHLRTDTISIDYRQIIELRAINMLEASCVKKSVTHNAKAIVKDLKTKKANTTKLFSQKYTSFHMKMKKIMQIEKEKKTMEYIKFVKDNGLEEYIFMSSEDTLKPVIKNIRSEIDLDNLAQYSGETIDKFVEEGMKAHNISIEDDEEFRKNMKSAYSMFLDIVSIYKNIKLYEEIQEENINAATGKTKTKFIPGFRL